MATPTGIRCTIDVCLQEFESWDTRGMPGNAARGKIKRELAVKLGVHPLLISGVSPPFREAAARVSFVVYVRASFEQINPKYRPNTPSSKKPTVTTSLPNMSLDDMVRRYCRKLQPVYAYEQAFGTNNKRKHKPVPFEVKREEKKSDIVVKRKRKINL